MKKSVTQQTASRREFLRGLARFGGLSLCAGVGWTCRQQLRFPGQTCLQLSFCGNCTQLATCSLPPARLAKDIPAGG